MKIFLNFQKQNLAKLLEELFVLNNLYNTKAFEFDEKLQTLLKKSKDYFNSIGAQKEELELGRLEVYFKTALQGINPQSLERLKTGKRSVVYISGFYCLNSLNELFQNQLEKFNVLEQEAYDTLSNLVLSMIQNAQLTKEQVEQISAVDACVQFWEQIRQNEMVFLIEKKLMASLFKEDIYIILDKIFTNIND